jgi:hypothetical protein
LPEVSIGTGRGPQCPASACRTATLRRLRVAFRRLCWCGIFFTTKAFLAGLRWSRKPMQDKAFAYETVEATPTTRLLKV